MDTHWIRAFAPFCIAVVFACGSEEDTKPVFQDTVQAEQPVCPDCPSLTVDVTVYESIGEFDIDIGQFQNFDYSGVTEVEITFTRGSQDETASLPFGPEDIESGVTEAGLDLPGTLDYTVDAGLSARLVFTEPGTSNIAFSSVTLHDGE